MNMKHMKYFEIKNNSNYAILNLITQKNLSQSSQNNIIDMIKSGDYDLNLTDSINNRTALIWSLFNRYSRVTYALIDAGVDLDIQDDNGNTALIISAMGCSMSSSDYFEEFLYALIDAGSDWYIKNGYTQNQDFLMTLRRAKNEGIISKIKIKYKEKYEEYIIKKEADKYNL